MTNTPKLAEALAKAQATMSGAKKSAKNPFFKSSYADLASVFDAIREPFAANGLSVSQPLDVLESGRTVVKTLLMHSSGECIESKMLLPEIADPQKIGSAITYFRRYSLMSIAGIPAEDDDGNDASRAVKNERKPAAPRITAEQITQIEELINGHTEIRKTVLDQCNGDFANIGQDQFAGAMGWIKNLIAKTEAASE